MDGLTLQSWLAKLEVALPVIVITGQGDVQTAVRAMKGGAVDFIKRSRIMTNRCSTRSRRRWRGRVGPIVPTKPEKQSSGLPSSRRASARFSTRSWQATRTAYDLGINVRTVEVHRARMMERLRVRQLAEAIRLSVMAGLVRL